MDGYDRILLAWPGTPSDSAQLDEKQQISEHGLQRWQQGYQLRDLTREWGHLHMSVMVELDHYALANPDLETAVVTAARQAWSQLCWDGISDSSNQYWHLNQLEASGHVRDLEQALSILCKLLKMDGPASMPVEGDQAKVQRILQNLLLNALKYTQRGGVTVIWKIPGEGVGLSIVKRLCELLNASLELETSPGKGSTFRVIFPRYYAVTAES